LNSPDTPLFEKGRVLYAWAAARTNLARSETGEAPAVIVVEGYMDVIALHRAGFGTAVAPLGTALTEAHLQELWRLSPEPVLCLDGDTAGQRAMLRALHRALPLLQPGRSLRFAVLPAGEDPPPPPRSPPRLRREILLRMLLQHPFLAGEASEEIAALDFPEPELDRLRREILQVEVVTPGLDASGLRQHLERCGFGAAL